MSHSRIISLSVGVNEGDDWHQSFQKISEIASDLDKAHNYPYVHVSCVSPDDIDAELDEEELYHDENTVSKVRKALLDEGLSEGLATDAINAMQSAGILFRERRP